MIFLLFAFVGVAYFSEISGNVVSEEINEEGCVSAECTCQDLNENDCLEREYCQPVYRFSGCIDEVCDNPKTYHKCIPK